MLILKVLFQNNRATIQQAVDFQNFQNFLTRNFDILGPVARRRMVCANHWLRSIKTCTFRMVVNAD